MSDPDKKCKFELTRSANLEKESEITNLHGPRKEEQEFIEVENQDPSYIDQMIEDLFHRLFGPNLSGETFIDQEINEFLNEFIAQIQLEREFLNE
ncbi:MAG: hypothetical protein GPJ54_04200 [Candidatus Heimdallarchaeota archaeon]|nr:hypothetical protein [Candidatus Heimdallarchaeota archaeon]